MTQYSSELLNANIAPGIAEFTFAVIPDLRSEFPGSTRWLSRQFLVLFFGPQYKGNWKLWDINLLFRAKSHFDYYHNALDATQRFLEASGDHDPSATNYYAAIALWESAFINLQIFIDLFCKAVKQRAFETHDGSGEERAYRIANKIKHWGEDITQNRITVDHTIPLWMSNDGFHTIDNQISYRELSGITREVARTAEEIINPLTAGPKH